MFRTGTKVVLISNFGEKANEQRGRITDFHYNASHDELYLNVDFREMHAGGSPSTGFTPSEKSTDPVMKEQPANIQGCSWDDAKPADEAASDPLRIEKRFEVFERRIKGLEKGLHRMQYSVIDIIRLLESRQGQKSQMIEVLRRDLFEALGQEVEAIRGIVSTGIRELEASMKPKRKR